MPWTGVHNGRLYAGTLGEAYVYEGGTGWTYIGTPCHNTPLHALKDFKGTMDEVRIYNRALDPVSVKALYDKPPAS